MLAALSTVFALVLRAHFHGDDIKMLLPRGAPIVSSVCPLHPSVIARYEAENVALFLHNNFTMYKCFWGKEETLKEKVDTFRDISAWLLTYNHTLDANFADAADAYIWEMSESQLF